MKSHDFGEGDNFAEGLCLGFDDGDIRGEWPCKPKTPDVVEGLGQLAVELIIPKLGEVALLLGLEVEPLDECDI